MDCDALRERLTDHVDGLLDAAEADGAREHLAACAPCRDLQEEVRRGFAALDAWTDEDLPAGAFERLVARLPGVRPPALVGVPAAAAGSPVAPSGGAIAAPATARPFRATPLIPYLAGLATAAIVVAVVLPVADRPTPGSAEGGPAAVRDVEGSRGVPPAPDAVPAASPVAADGGAAPPATDLLPGERALRFDADGVRRRYALPDEVDPRRVVIAVDYVPPAVEPVGGVR